MEYNPFNTILKKCTWYYLKVNSFKKQAFINGLVYLWAKKKNMAPHVLPGKCQLFISYIKMSKEQITDSHTH